MLSQQLLHVTINGGLNYWLIKLYTCWLCSTLVCRCVCVCGVCGVCMVCGVVCVVCVWCVVCVYVVCVWCMCGVVCVVCVVCGMHVWCVCVCVHARVCAAMHMYT